MNEFEKKCKYLANFPNIGRNYDHLKPSLRGLNLANYIIFYRVINDDIEIIRIISGYRNLDSLFLDDV
ncbi:type II toxin-antitoxin system RelE/ParE family toxin [Geminocystis herdmanii]|uniref:type II toxin-antitoxin system RelE/ParE family toxin n=1 Tax=Geminocystis herdmanii TaxID=669359 RepID=UPI00277D11F3|nr:type II toxin-antitoxin system RelE/ParE family toxin [Geminocystis herdmanii]